MEDAIRKNDAARVRDLLQTGAVVTEDILKLASQMCHLDLFPVFMNERVHLPFTYRIIRDLMWCPGAQTVLVDVLVYIAQTRPSREIVLKYLDLLIREKDLSYFSAFVDALSIDTRDLADIAQETTPQPVSGKMYPRSKRAITKMTRLLGRTPDVVDVKDTWTLEHTDMCFCWDLPIGEYTDLYIPVTRYGKSSGTGYYGRYDEGDPSFTWYYVEPDSDFVLHSKRTYVARNKVQAFLFLAEDPKIRSGKYDTRMLETLIYIEDVFFHSINVNYNDTYLSVLAESDERPLNPETTVTNFFRDPVNKVIYGEGGEMDFLDEVLADVAHDLGYDTLVFTHQPGTYGRLVSECLDVRKRSTSFASIYRRS